MRIYFFLELVNFDLLNRRDVIVGTVKVPLKDYGADVEWKLKSGLCASM